MLSLNQTVTVTNDGNKTTTYKNWYLTVTEDIHGKMFGLLRGCWDTCSWKGQLVRTRSWKNWNKIVPNEVRTLENAAEKFSICSETFQLKRKLSNLILSICPFQLHVSQVVWFIHNGFWGVEIPIWTNLNFVDVC